MRARASRSALSVSPSSIPSASSAGITGTVDEDDGRPSTTGSSERCLFRHPTPPSAEVEAPTCASSSCAASSSLRSRTTSSINSSTTSSSARPMPVGGWGCGGSSEGDACLDR